MTIHPLWTDEYWLLLMQLYLRKPVGLKPTYSRAMVGLALELHIPPTFLHEQMFRLRHKPTPALAQLWETYGGNRRRLDQEAKKVRRMMGFGRAKNFYAGVDVVETFEKSFQPLDGNTALKPVSLIMALDLYFRLTPITMVARTPEVKELAKLLGLKPEQLVGLLEIFQSLDPYLNRPAAEPSPLLSACQEVWQQYGNDHPDRLSALAAQLREYFV